MYKNCVFNMNGCHQEEAKLIKVQTAPCCAARTETLGGRRANSGRTSRSGIARPQEKREMRCWQGRAPLRTPTGGAFSGCAASATATRPGEVLKGCCKTRHSRGGQTYQVRKRPRSELAVRESQEHPRMDLPLRPHASPGQRRGGRPSPLPEGPHPLQPETDEERAERMRNAMDV